MKEDVTDTVEEKAESPEEAATEAETGEEGYSAPIPEDFQKQVKDMIDSCNEEQLNYIRHCLGKRETEMMDENKPKEFSTEDMPAD